MAYDNLFKFAVGTVVAGGLLTVNAMAHATVLEYEFALSNGAQSAQATFTFSDESGSNTLDIVLTNTMTTNDGPQWLTGLFFDIAGSPDLTNASVSGDMITLDSAGNQTPFTDESPDEFWGFQQEFSAGDLPFGEQQYGLGAAGFDVFGPSDVISGSFHSLNGPPGGVLADIPDLDVPNGFANPNRPFFLGDVHFSFDLPDAFDIHDASVDNVAFVFGSDFGEIVLVPVPPAVALGAFGLISLAAVGVRRKFKNTA